MALSLSIGTSELVVVGRWLIASRGPIAKAVPVVEGPMMIRVQPATAPTPTSVNGRFNKVRGVRLLVGQPAGNLPSVGRQLILLLHLVLYLALNLALTPVFKAALLALRAAGLDGVSIKHRQTLIRDCQERTLSRTIAIRLLEFILARIQVVNQVILLEYHLVGILPSPAARIPVALIPVNQARGLDRILATVLGQIRRLLDPVLLPVSAKLPRLPRSFSMPETTA